MASNSSSVEPHADAALRIQEKFEFYLVALTFTVLGLSVQTSANTAARITTVAELLGWSALLVSGIVGLWRLEWMAPTLITMSERETRASLAKTLRETIGFRIQVLSQVDRALISREKLQAALEGHEAAVTHYEKKVADLERRGLVKYRVQKVTLLAGLLSLMVSRALPHVARFFGYTLL